MRRRDRTCTSRNPGAVTYKAPGTQNARARAALANASGGPAGCWLYTCVRRKGARTRIWSFCCCCCCCCCCCFVSCSARSSFFFSPLLNVRCLDRGPGARCVQQRTYTPDVSGEQRVARGAQNSSRAAETRKSEDEARRLLGLGVTAADREPARLSCTPRRRPWFCREKEKRERVGVCGQNIETESTIRSAVPFLSALLVYRRVL
ncbi:hypothetical protein DFH11DRAFT_698980 [Phellopilus nigrolimitatus]|nr:hypothetical protein DFH11DRAFT_698980 [Phellopilus nigrolimitatus]